ncbi:MAG: iron ABC transporter permease [Spirochaetia bacterium]|jgi:iron(III) transport system permease protein|uniref:ABC-type Fe3+ transport system permease component n=2 Tax=root TaxID=1 RepID=A0A652ZSU3_9SPIR|nr:iron ABC transporter permease [Spirochaetia bacterium]MCE1209237.1 iron ABC transporter permease [Spirochaetia bacterium]NLX44799.1 iron ABC transporter permease [Treponema sp.]VBB38850.1 ABC-type Fe3+ transport system permease component [uncultured Spirochaetota bacterium]HOI22994.1 iron ABC transporter permease [Spirochaetales bacterium]
MNTGKKLTTANLVLVFSILVLVIVVAVPVILIILTAFFENGKFNIAGVMKILSDPDTYQALWNSVLIATGTTLVSTTIGTFFAWLVARTDLPFKKAMKALFLVPFMLPSFIGALAWKVLLSSRAGYINKLLMAMFGLERAPIDIMSLGGIIAIESMYLFPFVFLQVAGALERMDPTLEESARISGAGLGTITGKITLPLVMPSILSGALLVALYSLSHFGVPSILGTEKGIYNIPTKIYERIYASGGSFGAIRVGTILSTILVISAALILKLQDILLKKGQYQIIAGKSMRPMVLKLRGLKLPLLIISIVYILITVVLPTVTIFMVGGLKTYGLTFQLKNMTWDNYIKIFQWKMTKDAIWNSIYLSLSAAFVTMLAGTMISYVIVKMKVKGKFLLQFLGVLPFSLPGTVIALGVILTWSGRFGINIYNTPWIIFVAYIARYMAFSIKSNSASLSQVSDSLEEASRACGASHWQSLKDIVIPLIKPGMISAFFLIFLPALRELTTSVLLYGPTTRTIGVAIYALNEDGETVRAAALASIALVIIFVGETVIRKFLAQLDKPRAKVEE